MATRTQLLANRLLAFSLNIAVLTSFGAALPSFAGNQAAVLNNEGVKALGANNFQLAIQKFEEALQAEPGYQYAKDNLAIAYNNYALKLPAAQAIKYFHKAMFIQPGNATTAQNLDQVVQSLGKGPKSFKDRQELGKQCRLSGDFEGAIVEFQAALKIQNDPKLHVDLGDVLRVKDKTDEAITEYQAALAGGLDDVAKAPVFVSLGQCYQAKKDLKNAIAAYGNALKYNSDNRDVLEALKTGWEEALRENPQAPENHIGLGQAYQYSGDFGMAEAEYKQALVFDRNNQIAQKLLGDLGKAKARAEITKHINAGVDLQLHKQFDEAIKEYIIAQRMDPTNADIWVNIGSALQAKSDFARAVQAYQKALAIKPDNKAAQQGIKASTDADNAQKLDGLLAQAGSAYKAGQYEQALNLYQAVLRQTPDDAGVHFNIAAALQQLKRIDEAIVEYKNAVRLDPKNAEYATYLDKAYDVKADPITAQALAAHKEKNYGKAIDLYQQALALRPKQTDLYFNMASAMYSAQRYAEARTAYAKALEMDPKGQSNDLYFLGAIDENSGKGYDAMADYKKYLQASPGGIYAKQASDRLAALTKDPSATVKIKSEDELARIKEAEDSYNTAVKLQQDKQYDQALPLYQKAISLQPKEASYPYALASLYFAKGDIDSASQWVDKAIAIDPANKDYTKYKQYLGEQNAEKIVNQAVDKQKAQDFKGAVALYQQALQLVPKNARLWTNLASAVYATDDFNGALNAFQKAVEIDPKAESNDFYSIGLIQENFGRAQQAMDAYRKFLQYNPGDKLASNATDRINALTKDPRSARALPTHAQAEAIASATAAYDLGVKAQQAKNYDEALNQYKTAQQLNPKEGAYPFAIGSIYQAQGDMNNAAQYYQQALALDPKNPDYKKYLDGVQVSQAGPLVDQASQKYTAKDYAGAIALYKQALQIIPNDPSVHTDLASAMQANDDFQGALTEYQKAYDIDPKSQVEVLYFLGALNENFGNGSKALQLYREYAAKKPNGQFVSYAKQRMDALAKNSSAIVKLQTAAERDNSAKAQGLFDEAVKLQTAGKFDDADQKYAELVAAYPTEGAYAYARGTNFQGKGDMQNAVTWYQKAVSLAPTNSDYKKALNAAQDATAATVMDAGVQKYNAGDLPGAIEAYKQAAQVLPKNGKIHTNMAIAYQAMGNWAAARDEYQRGFDLDNKGEVDNLYFMGPLDETLGKGKIALADYTKYLQYAPKGTYSTQANARYQVLYFDATKVEKLQSPEERQQVAATSQAFNDAVALQTAGKVDEAIAKYQEALKGNEKSDQIWYSFGTAKQAKGDLQGAVECYQKAIVLNPKEATYKQTMKDAKAALVAPILDAAFNKQTKENNIVGAIADYLSALKVGGDDAYVFMNLGTAYQANKAYTDAMRSYMKAVSLDPKQADPHYFLGTLYEGMSKPAEAKAEYAKYVQMAPTGSYASDAKNRLKLLGGK